MKRPRNIAIKLVLFLVLGAIVNVAVAWGCAMWSPANTTIVPNSASIREQLEFGRTIYGTQLAVRDEWQLSGVAENGTHIYERNPFLEPITLPHSVSAGWPRRSLIGSFSSRAMQSSSQPSTCVVLPERLCMFSASRDIPIDPIWPGFAINTIFYAAVLWVLFAAPGMVKRYRRRVRGRCIHCGYDLRGHLPGAGATPEEGQSIKCPECGLASR